MKGGNASRHRLGPLKAFSVHLSLQVGGRLLPEVKAACNQLSKARYARPSTQSTSSMHFTRLLRGTTFLLLFINHTVMYASDLAYDGPGLSPRHFLVFTLCSRLDPLPYNPARHPAFIKTPWCSPDRLMPH